MINSLTICNVATFDQNPVDISKLSLINYFYGANGSGKTTISRIIAKQELYDSCTFKWASDSRLEAMVYNRDFVDANFHEAGDLPGIFTLGEHNADVIARIDAAKKDRDKLDDETRRLKITLEGEDGEGGKRAEIAEVQSDFRESCWKQKQAHEGDFKTAFLGFLSKERFCDKVLAEHKSNKATSHDIQHLREKAKTLFRDDLEKVDVLPTIATDVIEKIESDSVLSKTVVGRSDVDIAKLIHRLGNSDWVRSGRKYFNDHNKTCPFCQQRVRDNFAQELEVYFDETFEADIGPCYRLQGRS